VENECNSIVLAILCRSHNAVTIKGSFTTIQTTRVQKNTATKNWLNANMTPARYSKDGQTYL